MGPPYSSEGMERAKMLVVFQIRLKEMFYVDSRFAISSLSVQGYACLKSPILILVFSNELSELGPGYRIIWTCSTHMELLHDNKHMAGNPQRQEQQGNALLNSAFKIKK